MCMTVLKLNKNYDDILPKFLIPQLRVITNSADQVQIGNNFSFLKLNRVMTKVSDNKNILRLLMIM